MLALWREEKGAEVRSEHWRAATRHAEVQHGLVTAAQLRATGASPRSRDRAVARGRLVLIRRSVYAVAGSPESPWRPLMAACLAAGPAAVASHRAAAGLHGLVGFLPGAVELTATRLLRLSGVRCHVAPLARDDVVVVRGFRATSPARTVFDVAAEVEPALLRRVVGDAVRRRVCGAADLRRTLLASGGQGRAGTEALRAVVDDLAGGDSDLEARWLRALTSCGLRPAAFQHQLVVAGRVYVLDFAWPGARVGVEVDGWAFHRDRFTWDRDHDKANAYLEAGWRVVSVTSRTRHDDVVRQLRRFLAR